MGGIRHQDNTINYRWGGVIRNGELVQNDDKLVDVTSATFHRQTRVAGAFGRALDGERLVCAVSAQTTVRTTTLRWAAEEIRSGRAKT